MVTRSSLALLLLLGVAGCGNDSSATNNAASSGGSSAGGSSAGGSAGQGGAGGGSGGTGATTSCGDFEAGDPAGHSEPYGAKAAGQARAARLTAADVVQPAHGRQKVREGDYVLANEHVAFVIEGPGMSDGYSPFGAGVLSVDRVGDDGRPLGNSRYVEMLTGLSIEMLDPESFGVINDGSDGEAAVVRAVGQLKPIPFLDGALGALFSRRYGYRAAYEYVLEPGSEKLLMRVGVINPGPDDADLSLDEMHGLFQLNHNQRFVADGGFGKFQAPLPWLGFVTEDSSFALRLPDGKAIDGGLEISGFLYFSGPGFTAKACDTTWNDHLELIAGLPEADGLLEVVRRVEGGPEWVAVEGVVRDSNGDVVGGATVHATADDGSYLTRSRAGSDGSYRIHVPPSTTTTLEAHSQGYARATGVDVAATDQPLTQDLTLPAHATLELDVSDEDSAMALPVRIQVWPETEVAGLPESHGVEAPARGRLHQVFSMTGNESIVVPPGRHRVIVSRGYEWEIFDQVVEVSAGSSAPLDVSLERSVQSDGVMCADFHIHSQQSADSSDRVMDKVMGAIADGLEIPVSSEHEWVIDFQPVVEELGMTSWARGFPSSELTTFSWGHFGVVPIIPRPDEVNNGAIRWDDTNPATVFDRVDALEEKPFLIVNHPSGGGFGAYLSQTIFDRDTGQGTNDLWSDNFDALEVFNSSGLDSNRDESVADWFAMLNNGATVWAVGSSDSHGIRTKPTGYPRTCMRFGHDDPAQLDEADLSGALRAGPDFISGGIFLEVTGPNGERPGDTLMGDTNPTFTVRAQTPSWIQATELEVIVNGVTVQETPLEVDTDDAGMTYTNSVAVTFDGALDRSWVVFHVRGAGSLDPVHPGRSPFAVTNPMFFSNGS